MKKYKTQEEATARAEELCPGPEWKVNVWLNVEWRICWSAGPVQVYESVLHPGKFYGVVLYTSGDFSSGGPWTTTNNDSDSIEESAVIEIAAFLEYTREKRKHWDDVQSAIEKSGIKTVLPPKKEAV